MEERRNNKRRLEAEKEEKPQKDGMETEELDETDKWDEEEEEEEEESEDEKEIQVEFEIADVKEDDFAAVKRFLLNYLENAEFGTTEVADFVVGQTNVGSTIKVADSAEVYGFVSVLNMHQHMAKESVQQVWKYLMTTAPNSKIQEQLRELMENSAQPVGLILNERMVNVPSELAPHLHKTLFEEIAKAHEEEDSAAYNFENYLLITSVYNLSSGEKVSEPSKKKTKVGDEIFFFKAEDEVYMKEATFYYTFPMQRFEQGSRWTLDGMMIESRLVIVLHRSKVPQVLQRIAELFVAQQD